MVSNFSENIVEWHYFGRAKMWSCHSLQLAHLQFNGVNVTTTTTITTASMRTAKPTTANEWYVRVCGCVCYKGCWRFVSMLLVTTRPFVCVWVCGCARWWLHWICIFDMSVQSANIYRACGVHYEPLTLPITQSHTHTHTRTCAHVLIYRRLLIQIHCATLPLPQVSTPSSSAFNTSPPRGTVRAPSCHKTLLLQCLAASAQV